MTKPKYLRVTQWSKYQHYKDRRPVWIKFYIEMLDDFDLTALPIATQLLFDRLLLVAAKVENRIPNDPEWISKQTHLPRKVVVEGIPKLTQHGFVTGFSRYQAASTPLAQSNISASPEAEVEKEKEPPSPPSGKITSCPECGVTASSLPRSTTMADHRWQSHGVEAIDGRAA